jgi:hypothetical protein
MRIGDDDQNPTIAPIQILATTDESDPLHANENPTTTEPHSR